MEPELLRVRAGRRRAGEGRTVSSRRFPTAPPPSSGLMIAASNLPAPSLFIVADQRLQIGPQLRQRIGKLVIRSRSRPGVAPVLRNAAEHVARAAIALEHLLDGARDFVFRVAQIDVEVCFAGLLDFDQVAKAERLELVAILNEDVEVGIGDGSLSTCFRSETAPAGCRSGCLPRIRGRAPLRGRRIQPGPRPPPAISYSLRRSRRRGTSGASKRMGLRAEIAADQERLLQLLQVGSGFARDRVDIA